MAISYISSSNTTYASRTNTTITAPASIADGDILRCKFWCGRAGADPITPTAPAGWSASFGTIPQVADGSDFRGKLVIFWKRASGESGNYTFTHGTQSTEGVIEVFRGCLASGTPLGATSNNSGTGTTKTGTGITTTAADSWLLFEASDWDGMTLAPPTGMTERLDTAANYTATLLVSAAGATGNKTQSQSPNNSPWIVRMVELLDAGSSSQDLAPSLFTNSSTFHSATVTTGAVGLTPSLYANSNTFHNATVGSTYALTPDLFTDSDTFHSATVTVGAVDLAPSLFTNTTSFYSATVAGGLVTLEPSLFVNSASFHSATVSVGAVDLTPSLFTDGDTFHNATVTTGAVDLAPSLFTNSQTFYTHEIVADGATQGLTPSLFTNSSTFHAATITTGAVDLAPALFANDNTFHAATVAEAAEGITQDSAFYIAAARQEHRRREEELQRLQEVVAEVEDLPDPPPAVAAAVSQAREILALPVRDYAAERATLAEIRAVLARLQDAIDDEEAAMLLLVA